MSKVSSSSGAQWLCLSDYSPLELVAKLCVRFTTIGSLGKKTKSGVFGSQPLLKCTDLAETSESIMQDMAS